LHEQLNAHSGIGLVVRSYSIRPPCSVLAEITPCTPTSTTARATEVRAPSGRGLTAQKPLQRGATLVLNERIALWVLLPLPSPHCASLVVQQMLQRGESRRGATRSAGSSRSCSCYSSVTVRCYDVYPSSVARLANRLASLSLLRRALVLVRRRLVLPLPAFTCSCPTTAIIIIIQHSPPPRLWAVGKSDGIA
jgi:hypothetical protein